MKTDSLFYELFKAHPASLFELAGIEPDGEYVFESITVKSTEKRMDGFFRRTDGGGYNIFLEVQGYDDEAIYWRFLREISVYYELTEKRLPFAAVILFINEKYDPKDCPVSFLYPNRFVKLYLPDCLKAIGDKASPLTVFKPLILEKKKLLPESVPKWKTEIESLQLSESTNKLLIDLLENAILSRFPKLTLEEIQTMIRLTPLEKTVAGQELIQMGIDEGVLRGLEKGRIEGFLKGEEKAKKTEIIGKIHLAQRLLKRPIAQKKKLLEKSPKELRAILKQIEAELKIA
jgi:predicted transposase/invertase (TIGR01784 family)